jgi:AWS domain
MRLQRAVCRTLQADGCGEDCLNRHSYIHCDAKLCPAGAACSNRPFHQLRPPQMEVRTGEFRHQNRRLRPLHTARHMRALLHARPADAAEGCQRCWDDVPF